MIDTPKFPPTAQVGILIDTEDHAVHVEVDGHPVYSRYYTEQSELQANLERCTTYALGLVEGFLLAATSGCSSVSFSPFAHYTTPPT